MRRSWAIGLFALVMSPMVGGVEASRRWSFDAQLDGTSIGTHTFTLGPSGEMRSEATFAVKLLGMTVYRYRHRADERWKGDCLQSLAASTDDDGKKTTVAATPDDGALTLKAPTGTSRIDGCTMTFAYWNPAILAQTRLLDPQTGKLEAVRVKDLGPTTLELRGDRVPARHWRIDGPDNPIELWYSPAGDWLALESTVKGRKLAYLKE